MDRQNKILSVVRRNSKREDPRLDEMLFESGRLVSFGLPDPAPALDAGFGVSIRDADLRSNDVASIQKIERCSLNKGLG